MGAKHSHQAGECSKPTDTPSPPPEAPKVADPNTDKSPPSQLDSVFEFLRSQGLDLSDLHLPFVVPYDKFNVTDGLFEHVSPTTAAQVSAAFACGVACGVLGTRFHSRYLRTFRVVGDIPNEYFSAHRTIKGTVVSVSDGDTFRVAHELTPFSSLLNWIRGKERQGKLSESTLQVRLAGVDAPEIAHFGSAGQQYGPAAKQHLEERIGGRRVKVQLLQRDRYGRAVGLTRALWRPWAWPPRCASEGLLRAGLGTVYRGSDAAYGGRLDLETLEKLEAQAKRRKVGMWSSGEAVETPREYKARHR